MMNNSESTPVRYDQLIEPIFADFKPAPALWPVNVRIGLWLLLQVCIVVLIVDAGVHSNSPLFRGIPNLEGKFHEWEFILGVAALSVVGILSAASAIRSAVPGELEMRGARFALLIVSAAVGLLLMVHEPAHAVTSLHQFVLSGSRCAICVVTVAALPWIALFWAVRRAMPMWGATEGTLVGIAAFAFSFVISRMGCPIDDLSHVLLWHALPAALGAAASVLAGAYWLQDRWRTEKP